MEDYLCVTHPFSARRPAPRPELPGDDSSRCYSGVGTHAQSRNSCMHVAWFLANPRTLVPLELPELLQARFISLPPPTPPFRRNPVALFTDEQQGCWKGCWRRCVLVSNRDGGGGEETSCFPKGPCSCCVLLRPVC